MNTIGETGTLKEMDYFLNGALSANSFTKTGVFVPGSEMSILLCRIVA